MEYPYGKLKIQIFTQKDLQNLNKVLLDNAVDCDKIGNVLSVRSRKKGINSLLRAERIQRRLKSCLTK